jgi:hypothetical protein
MDRFLQQMLNMAMRMFMKRGINAGIDMMARRGKAPADMTPEERAQAAKGRDLAKKAQKMARLGRRLGR